MRHGAQWWCRAGRSGVTAWEKVRSNFLNTFLHLNLLDKTQEFVPQVLKQVVNLSCYLWNTSLITQFSKSVLQF